MVTHDVSEAVYLSNRICVMSARPGHIVEEFPVELDRTVPRETLLLSEAFNRIRNEVWLSVRRQSVSPRRADAAGLSRLRRRAARRWLARCCRSCCFGLLWQLVRTFSLVDPAFLPPPRRGRPRLVDLLPVVEFATIC